MSLQIDGAWYINLDRSTERRRSFLGNYPHGLLPEPDRFAATDGKLATPEPWYRADRLTWGCYDSHRRMIAHAAREGFQTALFFEDDAIPVHDFARKFALFVESLPADWQFLYLGGSHMRNHAPWKVNRYVAVPGQLHALHAYVIRQPLLDELAKWLYADGHGEYHVDHQLAWKCVQPPRGRWYAPMPELGWLFGQASGKSDRRGSTSGYFGGRPLPIGRPAVTGPAGRSIWQKRPQRCDVGPGGKCKRFGCYGVDLEVCRVGAGLMEVPV